MKLMQKTLIYTLVIIVVAIAGVWVWKQYNPEKSPVCSGIAGIKCPAGYRCEITEKYPDAMGTCVRS